MAFDWSSFLQDEYCTIGQFVENVIYGEYEKYDTTCLNYDIFTSNPNRSQISDLVNYIDSISTKDSVIQELELTLLLYQDPFVINSMQGQYRTSDGQIILDKNKISHLKNFIHTYKEDAFPYMKNERNNIRMLDNGRIGIRHVPVRHADADNYLTTELARALLRYHNEHKFVAPQSFLDCFGQEETQSRSMCKTNSSEMPQGRYVDVPVLLERWDMRAFELANIARRHGTVLFNSLGALFDFSLLDELYSCDQKFVYKQVLGCSILRTDAIRLEKEVGLLPTEEPPSATPQDKTEDDTEEPKQREKPSRLEIIYALFTELDLPTKKENSSTIGMLKKALETRGVDLDRKTIETLLQDLERLGERKKGKHSKPI